MVYYGGDMRGYVYYGGGYEAINLRPLGNFADVRWMQNDDVKNVNDGWQLLVMQNAFYTN